MEIITPKVDEPTPDQDLEPEIPKISWNSTLQSTTTPPGQHQQATEDIRRDIEPQIGINAYKHFFSNISIVNETHDTISLYSPHGNHIANLIHEQYSTKLANILGKNVKIITS